MALQDQLSGIHWASELGEGDFITDAIIVARYTDMETGVSGLFMAASEGTDIISVLGLLEAGKQLQSGEWDLQ